MKATLTIFLISLILMSCSFDNYGDSYLEEDTTPDLVMEYMDYTRVRGGKMSAHLKADLGERYENKHLMNLSNYTFEQYDTEKAEVDAAGDGGKASIEMQNNNVKMSEGINIRLDSEDFMVETMSLEWQDKPKTLTGADDSPVHLSRNNGTEMTGSGFFMDVRSRKWVFGSDVHGTYVHEDDEETEETKPKTETEKP